MSELRSDIDRIGKYLGGASLGEEDRAELAERYAEAVREANLRLEEFEDCLAGGRRGEALHIADSDPPLTELVALLDFAEADTWRRLCERWGEPVAEPLNFELADLVENAYAEAQPLASLMRQHRGLALARAPLSRRLAVLRAIRAADRQPQWDEMIERWETVRLAEIPAEAKEAARAGQLSTLKSLDAELADEDWLTPVPDSLRAGVRKVARRLTKSNAEDAIPNVATQLVAAARRDDPVEARRLRGEFERLARQADLSDTDPVRRDVAESLDWLDQVDRYEANQAEYDHLAAAIERAIDDNEEETHLTGLASKVEATGRALPEDLELRLRKAIGARRGEKSRRRAIVVGGVLAIVALVGVAAWTAYSAAVRRGQVDDLVAAIDRDLDGGRYEDAAARFEAAGPLAAEPPVMEAGRRVRQQTGERNARLAKLTALLPRLEDGADRDRIDELYAEGTELVDPPEFPAYADQIAQLDAARETAVNRIAAMRAEKSEQFGDAVADLRDRMTAVETAADGEDDAFAEAVDGFRERLAAAEAIAEALDGDQKTSRGTQLSALSARVDRIVDSRREGRQWREQMRSLAQKADLRLDNGRFSQVRFDQMIDALGGLSEQLRESTLTEATAGQIDQSLDEASGWAAAIRLLAAAEGWQSPADTKEVAEDRLQVIEELFGENPRVVGADLLKPYYSHLQAVTLRRQPTTGPIAILKKTLADPRLSEAIRLRASDGRIFYAPPSERGADELDTRLMLYRTLEPGRGAERANTPSKDRVGLVGAGDAPQNELARDLLDDLSTLDTSTTDADWTAAFATMIDRVQSAQEIPDALRLTLLRKFVEQAGRGHGTLKTELQPVLDAYRAVGWQDDANWIDPGFAAGRDETKAVNAAARRLERALPQIEGQFEAARERLTTLRSDIARPYRAGGLVLPTKSGTNRVVLADPPADGADPPPTYLIRTRDRAPALWERIKTPTVLRTDAGQLVFVEQAP